MNFPNFKPYGDLYGISLVNSDGSMKTFDEVYKELLEVANRNNKEEATEDPDKDKKKMTVIDRDDIILFFNRDANFNHRFQQLIEKHKLNGWGKTPERAEAMLADFRNWIYLELLHMDTYEVDVSERF